MNLDEEAGSYRWYMVHAAAAKSVNDTRANPTDTAQNLATSAADAGFSAGLVCALTVFREVSLTARTKQEVEDIFLSLMTDMLEQEIQ